MKRFNLFLERGEGKERGRETLMCDCLSHLLPPPHWGPGPKPRSVPWWGIEPAMLRTRRTRAERCLGVCRHKGGCGRTRGCSGQRLQGGERGGFKQQTLTHRGKSLGGREAQLSSRDKELVGSRGRWSGHPGTPGVTGLYQSKSVTNVTRQMVQLFPWLLLSFLFRTSALLSRADGYMLRL